MTKSPYRSWTRKTCLGPLAAIAILAPSAAGIAAADPVSELVAKITARIAAGDLANAEIELKKGIGTYPDRSELRLMLGKIYLRKGDPVSAEEDFKLARQNGAAAAEVEILLAQTWLARGDADRVLREVQPGSFSPEDNARIQTARALAYIMRHQNTEADHAIDEAQKLASGLPEVGMATAKIRLVEGKPDAGEAVLDALLAQNEKNIDALIMKGQFRQGAGDLPGALAAYDKVLANWPGAGAPRIARAAVLMGLGREAEADQEIDLLLKSAPKQPILHLLKSQILAQANKAAEAWEVLQTAISDLGDNLGAQILAASLNIQLGHLAQARAFAEKAITLAPENPIALRLMADWHFRNGDFQKSAALLEKVIEKNPNDQRALGQLGAIYGRLGRYTQASEMFERAARQAPEDSNLKFSLGLSQLEAGNLSGAMPVLEQAANGAGNPRATATLVIVYLNQKRFEDARKEADAYAKLEPSSPLSDFLLGQVSLATGEFDKAASSFAAAIKKSPEFFPAHQALATVYQRQGHADQAEGVYTEVLKRDPKNEKAYLGRIGIAVAAGDAEGAVQFANEAVAANPNAASPGIARVELLLRLNRSAEALAKAQELQAGIPDQPDVLATLARAQLANNKNDEGIATLRALAKKVPGTGDLQLAEALLRLNHPDEARAALDDAVSKNPNLLSAWELRLADEARRHGPDSALALLRRAQQPVPAPMANFLTGEVLLSANRNEEAVKSLQAAYSAFPGAAAGPILPILHQALIRAKHPAEARQLVTSWVEKNPADTSKRLILADQLMNEHENAKAIEQYEQVLRFDPESVPALNNLALLYFSRKDTAKALEMAQNANKLAPTVPSVKDTLGWLLMQSGTVKDAVPLLEQANDRSQGKDPSITYHLAAAYSQSGQAAKASALLKPLVAKSFPEQADAKVLYGKVSGSK